MSLEFATSDYMIKTKNNKQIQSMPLLRNKFDRAFGELNKENNARYLV
jgi:hypothetical protein